MSFDVEVKLEDKDYTYKLSLQKLLKVLKIKKTNEQILQAVKETIRRS